VTATWHGPEAGPTLLLNGHLDVVPAGEGWSVDPYAAILTDGCVCGRGATDMKGPLACMVTALRAIMTVGESLQGTVIVGAVVGEEDTQVGTKQLAKDGIRADFAIVGEPTSLKPVIAHKGDMYFEITTWGEAAHASTPEQGQNAILDMFAVGAELEALSRALRLSGHPLVGHPTLSIGMIEGGTATNVVPNRCVISIDRRLIPGESPEEAKEEIQRLLEALKTSHPDLSADVTVPVVSLPMETREDEPVVEAVRAATERVVGRDPGVHGWSAACDANILVNELRIPTVVFGPGDLSEQAHKPDERIEIEQLMIGTKIFALTMLGLLGRGRSRGRTT